MKAVKTTHRAALSLACLALLLGGAGPARATVIYDNLNAATNGNFNFVSAPDGPLADSFSTGSSAVGLVDVKVQLYIPVDPPSPFTTVQLLSDNAGSPGSVLTTLGTVSDSALSLIGPAVVDFPLSTPFALAADTRYWVELSTSTGSNAAWPYSADTSGVGVANEFFFGNGSVHPNSTFGGPYVMQVTVTPEPASLLLAGLGAVGLLVAVRRRRKA